MVPNKCHTEEDISCFGSTKKEEKPYLCTGKDKKSFLKELALVLKYE